MTTGLVLLVTMVAFEGFSVNTAMPVAVRDLGGIDGYAWPFVAFTAANVVGTVAGGHWSDRRSPRGPLLASPIFFGAGLVVAGTAPGMGVLLLGRVLQGTGGGLLVAVFVVVGLIYPERVRPVVIGLLSSAYVLPALVGPLVAGLVTEAFGWRWVFLALLPFVLLACVLARPAVSGPVTGPPGPPAPAGGAGIVLAAVTAAVGVSALSWAPTAGSGALSAVVAVAALALLALALPRLLVRGTLLLRRGLPAVVLCRGLLVGTFMSVNTYLPLMLVAVHGWSVTAGGLPLSAGSVSWSAAALAQARFPGASRIRFLRAAFGCVAVASGGVALVAAGVAPAWLTFPLWVLAGSGMGLGFSALMHLVTVLADPPELGSATSSAQIAEQVGIALLVGAGGAALVATGSVAAGLVLFAVLCASFSLAGTVLAGRVGG